MKRIAPLLLFLALFAGACKKEIPTAEVTFSVRETSQANPPFQIEFTSDPSGGSTVASNSDNYWTSGKITLNQGQFVSLKVTCTEPQFDIDLYLYVNGNLWKTSSFSNPTTSASLSGDVPSE